VYSPALVLMFIFQDHSAVSCNK